MVDVPAAIVTSSEYARVPVESLSSRVMVSPYAIGRRKKKGSQRAEGKKGQRSARLGGSPPPRRGGGEAHAREVDLFSPKKMISAT